MQDTPDINLRPATRDDLAMILEGCRETFERHRRHMPFAFSEGAFDAFYEPYIANCIEAQTKVDEARLVQVAEVDGVFAGYVVMADSANTGGGFEIFDIHVRPEYRKKGVGQALLNWGKSLAEEFEAHNLDATVWNLGDSREDFFERSGFAKVHTRWRVGPMETPSKFTSIVPKQKWSVFSDPGFLWTVIFVLLTMLFLK